MRMLVALALVTGAVGGAHAQERRTEAVVLIVVDGVRWQEVFRGADSLLLSRAAGGVDDTAGLRREFWRPTAEERRRVLFPFLWDSVAARGQLFGNRDVGSAARVTNGFDFSYPGYQELLAGFPDPAIDRNDFGPNPNVTVFEWLAGRAGFHDRVAAFGTWDAFAAILNRERAGFPVHVAWEPPFERPRNDRQAALDRLYRTTTRYWPDVSWDAFMHAVVLERLRELHPRALFIGFGETDTWAHERRYDLYLRQARQVDRFIAELWSTMQGMRRYRGRTTFIITTDHGRGDGPDAWRSHGREVAGADAIFLAVIGPDTPPLGERRHAAPVTLASVAATLAALLGEDYARAQPRAAPPIADLLPRGR
jgi:hypothetical protein